MTDPTPVTPPTKRRVVLDLVPTHPSAPAGSSALYALPDDNRDAPAITLPLIYLTPEDFRALGEREQITITIEPGNTTAPPAEHQLCGGEACETTGECQARSQCEYRTDAADEEFCPRCLAGTTSDEHHGKCVVTGHAIDGEPAS